MFAREMARETHAFLQKIIRPAVRGFVEVS